MAAKVGASALVGAGAYKLVNDAGLLEQLASQLSIPITKNSSNEVNIIIIFEPEFSYYLLI